MASNSTTVHSAGCRHAPAAGFHFERDTFCFANELVWQYEVDAATGRTTIQKNSPPPTYAQRCFVMVRSARQFFYHAQFDAAQPVAEEGVYRQLIHKIVAGDPRKPSTKEERIVIPGYDSLRKFSEAWTDLLKAECGQSWECYCMRSHWRMVFPVWRAHQERMARQLLQALQERPPIVHLFRFPHVTINHGVVLFDATESEGEIEFAAYDPNIPAHPVNLIYNRQECQFIFPRTHYWAGGWVKVVEVYYNWCY